MNSPEIRKIETETNKLKSWTITELKVPNGNSGETVDLVDYLGCTSEYYKETLYLHNYKTIDSRKELQQHVTSELSKQGTRVAVAAAQTNPDHQKIFFRLACTHYRQYENSSKSGGQDECLLYKMGIKKTPLRQSGNNASRGSDGKKLPRRRETRRAMSKDQKCNFSIPFCFDKQNSIWYITGGTGCICHSNHFPEKKLSTSMTTTSDSSACSNPFANSEKETVSGIEQEVYLSMQFDDNDDEVELKECGNGIINNTENIDFSQSTCLVRESGNFYQSLIPLFKTISGLADSDKEAYQYAKESLLHTYNQIQNIIVQKKRKTCEQVPKTNDTAFFSSNIETDKRRSAKRIKPIGEK